MKMRVVNALMALTVLMMSVPVEAGTKKRQQKLLAVAAQQSEVAAARGDLRGATAAYGQVVLLASGLPGDATAKATVQSADQRLAELKGLADLRAAQAERAAAQRAAAAADREDSLTIGGGHTAPQRRDERQIDTTNKSADMQRRFVKQIAPAGCLGGQCSLGIDIKVVTPRNFARLDGRDGSLYNNRAKIFKSGMAAFIAKGTIGSNLSAAQAEAGPGYNSKDLLTNIQYAVRNFGKAGKGVGDAVIVPKTLLAPAYLHRVEGREYGTLLPAARGG
jgi:hypothetical protein